MAIIFFNCSPIDSINRDPYLTLEKNIGAFGRA